MGAFTLQQPLLLYLKLGAFYLTTAIITLFKVHLEVSIVALPCDSVVKSTGQHKEIIS